MIIFPSITPTVTVKKMNCWKKKKLHWNDKWKQKAYRGVVQEHVREGKARKQKHCSSRMQKWESASFSNKSIFAHFNIWWAIADWGGKLSKIKKQTNKQTCCYFHDALKNKLLPRLLLDGASNWKWHKENRVYGLTFCLDKLCLPSEVEDGLL